MFSLIKIIPKKSSAQVRNRRNNVIKIRVELTWWCLGRLTPAGRWCCGHGSSPPSNCQTSDLKTPAISQRTSAWKRWSSTTPSLNVRRVQHKWYSLPKEVCTNSPIKERWSAWLTGAVPEPRTSRCTDNRLLFRLHYRADFVAMALLYRGERN